MPEITITGVAPAVDGSYQFVWEEGFTGNELHLIKNVSGVRAGEIGEALAVGDYDVFVAIAKIVLDRVGKDVTVEQLMAAKAGTITFRKTDEEEAEEEAEEALPPTSAPSGDSLTNSETDSSGTTGSNGSDILPASVPLVTGSQPSLSGSTSDPVTSAT